MAYIIMNNNPLIDAELLNPDVVVDYDKDNDRFYVTFIATNTGNVVNRGELVSEDFKFIDSIESEILSYCGEACNEFDIVSGNVTSDECELDVLITQKAKNAIYTIWMANCDIF